MRPAEVCGWRRNPSRSKADISLLTVAEETPTPTDTCEEPTGCAVSTCSVTTAFKMADLRGSRSSAGSGRVNSWRRLACLLSSSEAEPLRLDEVSCAMWRAKSS